MGCLEGQGELGLGSGKEGKTSYVIFQAYKTRLSGTKRERGMAYLADQVKMFALLGIPLGCFSP